MFFIEFSVYWVICDYLWGMVEYMCEEFMCENLCWFYIIFVVEVIFKIIVWIDNFLRVDYMSLCFVLFMLFEGILSNYFKNILL